MFLGTLYFNIFFLLTPRAFIRLYYLCSSTRKDSDPACRPMLTVNRHLLHLVNNLHSIKYAAEDDMMPVEMRQRCGRDEEL
mmetsp:Transcript_19498/g.44749  ORF Transcript_19498/g.44749 Transcript_19498/m.44749 type:complete len:81 (-) Transcript_19498:1516-1758(-)